MAGGGGAGGTAGGGRGGGAGGGAGGGRGGRGHWGAFAGKAGGAPGLWGRGRGGREDGRCDGDAEASGGDPEPRGHLGRHRGAVQCARQGHRGRGVALAGQAQRGVGGVEGRGDEADVRAQGYRLRDGGPSAERPLGLEGDGGASERPPVPAGAAGPGAHGECHRAVGRHFLARRGDLRSDGGVVLAGRGLHLEGPRLPDVHLDHPAVCGGAGGEGLLEAGGHLRHREPRGRRQPRHETSRA